jgi:hypothetical protein
VYTHDAIDAHVDRHAVSLVAKRHGWCSLPSEPVALSTLTANPSRVVSASLNAPPSLHRAVIKNRVAFATPSTPPGNHVTFTPIGRHGDVALPATSTVPC